MTGRDILKRTPVRLAAAFTALFTLTAVLLFAVLYFSLGARLERLIRQRVVDTQDALASIDSDGGFDELVGVVTSESNSVRAADSILSLVDRSGAFQAGGVRDVQRFEGWRVLRRRELPLVADEGQPDDKFFAIWRSVSKGYLLVGLSDREIRETQGLLLEGFGWGFLLTAALAALSGAYLARSAQRRISALASTLSAVSEGAIGVRVPVSGSGDDLDHVAEQINYMLGRLQKLIENVNQASSDIAHDLKKPIGRLRQRLDVARATAESRVDYQRVIDDALTDIDSITATFEALLRIAQIEAGARKARFERLDLGQLLRDMAEVYEPVAEDAGGRLVSAIDPSKRALIRGDRDLLTQMFANLVENAVRHCPAGTVIRLDLAESAERFTAVVADTGPGVPESERANVFRRFYRLERARSTAGSGLGLSLVAAIAELHGAALALSDNAPGLKVTIAFPKG